jgi:hypothetical protein
MFPTLPTKNLTLLGFRMPSRVQALMVEAQTPPTNTVAVLTASLTAPVVPPPPPARLPPPLLLLQLPRRLATAALELVPVEAAVEAAVPMLPLLSAP